MEIIRRRLRSKSSSIGFVIVFQVPFRIATFTHHPKVSGMPISNFTSDWNDGVALGALVNSMAPGALEDWENWSPNDALENTEKAMKSAQDLLKVAPLIAPAEMIHPEIDEMSVMTYLSQFPATKPIIMKPKVQATISNLDKILQVNDPREFDLKLSRDGFKPKVSIRDEDGQDIHLSLKKVEDKENAYKVKFTPTKIGFIHVDVAANDVHTFETQTIPEASVICQVEKKFIYNLNLFFRLFQSPAFSIITKPPKSEMTSNSPWSTPLKVLLKQLLLIQLEKSTEWLSWMVHHQENIHSNTKFRVLDYIQSMFSTRSSH